MSGCCWRYSHLRFEQLERRELLSVGAFDLLQSLAQNAAARARDDGGNTFNQAAAWRTSVRDYDVTSSTSLPDDAPAASGFQIDVTMSGFSDSQQEVVHQAIDRWEEIIVGDLSDVIYQGRVIDDIEISISALAIDGAGSILGQAAVTAVRSDSSLPCLGYIQLDTADVSEMERDGSLLGVLTHEIAHVLGFGIIWSELDLLTGDGASSPQFTGAQATAEYNAIFGTNATGVPVETDGGSGTRLSHWDESAFGTELMTGWYNSGEANAISRITVASMADLGYEVNLAAADTYTTSSFSLAASTTAVVSSQRSPIFYGVPSTASLRSRSDRLMAHDLMFGAQYVGLPV